MKIGICRFSQRFDIDFYRGSASALGTELRVPIMEALVNLGHDVHILSWIPEDQLWLFDHPTLHPIYDYSWLSHVSYDPDDVPELDLLIVECSTDNARFGGENLERFGQIMRGLHDTPCILYQHGDPKSGISVPLGDMYRFGQEYAQRPEGEAHLKNYLWGIHDQGNTWQIWCHSPRPGELLKINGARTNYAEHVSVARYLPLGVSDNFDRPLVSVPERERVDIIYVGREKSDARTRRLIELAGTGPCCTRVLYGKWQHPPEGWYYGGFVEGHGRVYELLPRGRSTIQISDPWFYQSGQLTTRLVQAHQAGVRSFVDADWHDASVFGTPISSHEEMHAFLKMRQKHPVLPPWESVLGEALRAL